jgi:hypothetical protein
VLSTMSSISNISFILTKYCYLTNKDKTKQYKKTKKHNNEQPWILAYTLILQTLSSLVSFLFFGLDQLIFLPKTIPCKLNHDLIRLGPKLLSESLGTDLKILINKNA